METLDNKVKEWKEEDLLEGFYDDVEDKNTDSVNITNIEQ